MEDDLRQNLMGCAETFCCSRKIKMTTLGRLSAADGRFFTRLSGDCTFTVKKYDEVMTWFSANWPLEAEWPPAVPRPDPFAAAA